MDSESGSAGTPKSPAADTGNDTRAQWLLKANDALDRMKQVASIAEKRDRPWLLAEDAWGEAAAQIRRRIKSNAPGAETLDSLNWEVYDLLFNKAYDKTIENARVARNPVAEVINQAMLTKLYAVHSDAFNQFTNALRQTDALAASLPLQESTTHYRPVPFQSERQLAPAHGSNQPETPQRERTDCAIFRDPVSSRALLARDSDTWLALNQRCNSNR